MWYRVTWASSWPKKKWLFSSFFFWSRTTCALYCRIQVTGYPTENTIHVFIHLCFMFRGKLSIKSKNTTHCYWQKKNTFSTKLYKTFQCEYRQLNKTAICSIFVVRECQQIQSLRPQLFTYYTLYSIVQWSLNCHREAVTKCLSTN